MSQPVRATLPSGGAESRPTRPAPQENPALERQRERRGTLIPRPLLEEESRLSPAKVSKPCAVAVVGPTGYAGAELFATLLRHPGISEAVPVVRDSATSAPGRALAELLPRFAGLTEAECVSFSADLLLDRAVELVFLSTPAEISIALVPALLEHGIRVVDLSGAFRLSSSVEFERWYGISHDSSHLPAAVYGLPELHAEEIVTAQLVANPGCYPTSVLLALLPLCKAGWVDLRRGIVCDSKSGVSGAGKEPRLETHFVEVEGNFRAYNLFRHRHTPEILEQLGIAAENLIFTTHLLPVRRGILSSIYVWLAERRAPQEVEALFRAYYAGKPMVRVHPCGRLPELQYVVETNFCDLGFALDAAGKRLVVVSCLDNLGKGAAGQAIQNMNWMLGFSEEEGLI